MKEENITDIEICEAKAAKVMQWIAQSEEGGKAEYSVARLFESGVLEENTKAFLHLILESQFPGDRVGLELPPEQLRALVNEAFTHTYLYLLSPHEFISDFLCFGTNTLQINQKTLARLTYFVNYPFFPEMINEWFQIQLKQGKDEIPKFELQDLLLRIDRTIIAYSSLDKLTGYLQPLFSFHEKTTLPLPAIEIFFDDKQLVLPANLQKENYTPEDIAFALKDAVLSLPGIESAGEFPPIPEYEQFLKELRDVGVVLPPPKQGALPENEYSPVEFFIGKKLRKKSIEKIFRGNKAEYLQMLKVLNAAREYEQAKLNFETMLGIRRISPESKTARRLARALRLKFKQEEVTA